jgi:phosphoglycerol transferase MdoB-like AlkP superfamily enzyme
VRARLTFLILYYGYWLAFFAAARLVFLGFFYRETTRLPLTVIGGTFRHGLPLDLAAAAYLSLIPFILIALTAFAPATRVVSRLLLLWTLIATALLALLAAADLGIFREWGRHIDAGVLQYLAHPRESWAAAGGGPRWIMLLLFLLLAGGFAALAVGMIRSRVRNLPPVSPWPALPLAGCALLLVVPARGGFQQIPINQSSAYFSPAPFANQAAINVGWNFFDSWHRGLNRRDNPYRILSMDSARAVVDSAAADTPDRIDANAGTAAAAPRHLGGARPNVLLIVWESFTARAVERLGGVPGVTPVFDSLAGQGLLFTRFYAAGDRTEKGLAAILAGAPTVPNASVLTIPSKARTLPMLSRLLDAAGYATSFHYGGELGFANIGSFVREGRFAEILGKSDFPRDTWVSKWGAHDETVADRLLADLGKTPQPFFAVWLTQSSHEPFDVPGPAPRPGADGESRFLNSLGYTDRVLGHLLERAAREPWWAGTLVVIVGDHSKKLERTDRDVPYKSAAGWYHVPMLWTGGALRTTGVVDRLASQTDLAPTLLGQLGIPGGEQFRFGRDLLAGAPRSSVFYAFDDGFGLVTTTGSLVWEHVPDRITSRFGIVSDAELRLGKAMLQLTYQDYLDRGVGASGKR